MLRGQEGIGLGDVKLLAMLGGWSGVKGAGICFAIGVAISLFVALLLYMIPAARAKTTKWSLKKLPFGTFLCAGGIICGLWGNSLRRFMSGFLACKNTKLDALKRGGLCGCRMRLRAGLRSTANSSINSRTRPSPTAYWAGGAAGTVAFALAISGSSRALRASLA